MPASVIPSAIDGSGRGEYRSFVSTTGLRDQREWRCLEIHNERDSSQRRSGLC